MKDDEIIAEVINDSLCMSSYRASELGEDHKKVPNDVHENPISIGHEFCGKILKVVYTHKSLELTEVENLKNISDNDFIKV